MFSSIIIPQGKLCFKTLMKLKHDRLKQWSTQTNNAGSLRHCLALICCGTTSGRVLSTTTIPWMDWRKLCPILTQWNFLKKGQYCLWWQKMRRMGNDASVKSKRDWGFWFGNNYQAAHFFSGHNFVMGITNNVRCHPISSSVISAHSKYSWQVFFCF